MTDSRRRVAEHPRDAGIDQHVADSSHLEGAHLLANEAAPQLTSEGFTRDKVFEWAEAYLEAEGGGTVDDFIEWITDREAQAPHD